MCHLACRPIGLRDAQLADHRRREIAQAVGYRQSMRVLHLGYNIASQLSVSVRALHKIGIPARGIAEVWEGVQMQSHDDVDVLPPIPPSRSLKWASVLVHRAAQIAAAIIWADVLHWHFGHVFLPRHLDLRWTRLLHKPGVAEFWGSDIRTSETDAIDNPYFSYLPEGYRAERSVGKSVQTQARFAALGFECVIPALDFVPYIRKDLFPAVHFVRQRLLLEELTPAYPDPRRRRIVIAHSPSSPLLKGTSFVLAAVDALSREYDIELSLIHKVPHAEALQRVAMADIFIDQMLLGGPGLAALEAMALGKPVICYIKPSMVGQYPLEMPIVNASIDVLAGTLQGLVEDGVRRHQLGRAGRAYVEKYHDAVALARQLESIYRGLLDKRFVRVT